jgi:hypothetical protein
VHADDELVAEAAGLQRGAGVAVVREVEAAVDPDAAIGDGHVLLRVHGPVAGGGDFVVGGHGVFALGYVKVMARGYMI